MTREQARNLLQIIKAYAEGKDIQYQTLDGDWLDNEDMDFSPQWNYRIKPELTEVKPITAEDLKEDKDISHKLRDTVQAMKTYRPFKSCDELVECYNNKAFTPIVAAGLDTNRNKMFRPNIWIKSKQYGTDNMIIAFDGDNESIGGSCVMVQDIWIDMQELFDNFTFCDGSVCGIDE